MGLYSFTLPSQQQDQSGGMGMQQYNQQGQGGVDPGRAPAMQAPQAPALANALQQQIMQQKQQQQQQQNGQFQAGQQALAQGGQAAPNMNGMNMGGVGPTVGNAAAQSQIMGANGIQPQSPSWMSQLFGGGSN
jgi:hypothetical protein